MSARMTGISLPSNKVAGPGLAEWGRKTPAEMIARYRQWAQHQLDEAQAVLNAADDDFHVDTYRGVYVQHDREVLQPGRPATAIHQKNEVA